MAFKIQETAAEKSDPDTEFWLEQDGDRNIMVKAKRGGRVRYLARYCPEGVYSFVDAYGVGIATDPDNYGRVHVIK